MLFEFLSKPFGSHRTANSENKEHEQALSAEDRPDRSNPITFFDIGQKTQRGGS